ncbi:DUF7565 family protein [Halocalculus aciditolerans]|uniref:C2H2-type domain-containing protein n=1 Tax=Halocalculus aciditolerans TaxID=1383812 RepID=A0A830FJS1_9EURY|nr:hypothetical protein [Halocalculus aciditolerans]GGL63359.1 hypothetical protein GCM10009039_21570 [Halocalculus aciditolerans]
MSGWECAIGGCGATFRTVESLLTHQVDAHERHECRICGTTVPEGFFAIKHVFEEHTRTEFVRAYDADASAIRERESIKRDVEDTVDPREIYVGRDADTDGDEAVASASN